MSMSGLEQYSEKTFEEIKHTNEYGQEFCMPGSLGLCSVTRNGETSPV